VIATAAVVIPKAMAATIASLPVQGGLYTASLPKVSYALPLLSELQALTCFNLQARGVELVGHIPLGLPRLTASVKSRSAITDNYSEYSRT
jgi:hypothetical protein